MKQTLYSVLVFIFSISVFAAESETRKIRTGGIQGTIINRETLLPLEGVKITLMSTAAETSSDTQGRYSFMDIAAGHHVISFAAPDYATVMQSDIVVKPNRSTVVDAALTMVLQEEISVVGGYFAREQGQPGSQMNFGNEEIRRTSGSAGDISRSISALPSVARVNDMQNSLIVRGGSPTENAFFIDNIPAPDISHFTIPGSTGGAIGMLNIALIREVNFFAGGFPSRFGDRLSAIMDIYLREGNRTRTQAELGLDMSGFGLVAEGPIADKKGSWLLSARHSYLDLLSKAFDFDGIIPRYANYQGKMVFDISPYSQVSLLGMAGNDRVSYDREKADKADLDNHGSYDGLLYCGGLNWRQIWRNGAYSNTSLSFSSKRTTLENAGYDKDEAVFSRNSERQVNLRNHTNIRFGSSVQMQFGFDLQYALNTLNTAIPDYYDNWGNHWPEVFFQSRISAGKAGLYSDTSVTPLPRLTITLGGRLDYFSVSSDLGFSPRTGVSFQAGSNTTLNASLGLYRQTLPLLIINLNKSHKLPSPSALHYLIGLTQMIDASVRLTVEAYYKDYHRLPLDVDKPGAFFIDEVMYGGGLFPRSGLAPEGKARSYGLEISLQKKPAGRLFGMICASFFRSQYRDFDGRWRNRMFDNRFIFALEGGYRISRGWELNTRWNYAGGTPFTPFDLEASRALNSEVLNTSQINAWRNPAIHSLNLRLDRRFYFKSANLIIFLDAWNVYSRKNVAFRYWNTRENEPKIEYQWGFIPILGVEFSF